MSRESFNPNKNAKMVNNSEQNKMVRRAALEVGIPPEKLSDFLHAEKNFEYHGDYSYSELVNFAKMIKEGKV